MMYCDVCKVLDERVCLYEHNAISFATIGHLEHSHDLLEHISVWSHPRENCATFQYILLGQPAGGPHRRDFLYIFIKNHSLKFSKKMMCRGDANELWSNLGRSKKLRSSTKCCVYR